MKIQWKSERNRYKVVKLVFYRFESGLCGNQGSVWWRCIRWRCWWCRRLEGEGVVMEKWSLGSGHYPFASYCLRSASSRRCKAKSARSMTTRKRKLEQGKEKRAKNQNHHIEGRSFMNKKKETNSWNQSKSMRIFEKKKQEKKSYDREVTSWRSLGGV